MWLREGKNWKQLASVHLKTVKFEFSETGQRDVAAVRVMTNDGHEIAMTWEELDKFVTSGNQLLLEKCLREEAGRA